MWSAGHAKWAVQRWRWGWSVSAVSELSAPGAAGSWGQSEEPAPIGAAQGWRSEYLYMVCYCITFSVSGTYAFSFAVLFTFTCVALGLMDGYVADKAALEEALQQKETQQQASGRGTGEHTYPTAEAQGKSCPPPASERSPHGQPRRHWEGWERKGLGPWFKLTCFSLSLILNYITCN